MPLKKGRLKTRGQIIPERPRKGDEIKKKDHLINYYSTRETGQVLVMGQGDVGQLGLGEEVLEVRCPRLVAQLQQVSLVACGGMHTAILTEGKVYTWGCNDEGALGRSAGISEDFHPGLVKGQLDDKRVLQISAGDSHVAALTDDGDVWAWGIFRDSGGPIGLVDAYTPATSPAWLASDCFKVASGNDHIGILSLAGEVLTLGCAEQGQLGRVHQIFSYRGGRKGVMAILTPQVVRCQKPRHAPKPKFVDIFCGHFNMFALTEDHALYVWGLNNYGQLGTDDTKSCFQPRRLPDDTFEELKELQVSGGQHHTVLSCAGNVYVMGRRDYGRLGLGQDDEQEPLRPKKVSSLSGAVDVAAGCACSLAVLESGRVYGWGMNTNLQLGVKTADEDLWTPVEVGGNWLENKKVLGVSLGGQHAALLVQDDNSTSHTPNSSHSNTSISHGNTTTDNQNTHQDMDHTPQNELALQDKKPS